jgi:60 kDa SS-A/Ro ribonucleoprotein
VDKWTRAERFLILGNEGGSYYAGERELTVDASAAIEECARESADRLLALLISISTKGRAAKVDPVIFALARMAACKGAIAERAATAIPVICRTGTHLLQFCNSVEQLGGWSMPVRNGVNQWFLGKSPDDLAYQVTKYQQRDGWAMADVLRRTHPKTTDPQMQSVFRWIVGKPMSALSIDRKGVVKVYGELPPPPMIIQAMTEAMSTTDPNTWVRLIRDHRLVREHLPTAALNSIAVWDALLLDMPLTAMIRNLGKMTSLGLLKPLSDASQYVVSRLRDRELLRRARVHPVTLLLALMTYKNGHGIKGKLSWQPVQPIVTALDDAFYAAFEFVPPTNKRQLLALDTSGSMTGPALMGTITPREASAAMALVTANCEPNYHIIAFSDVLRPLNKFCAGIRLPAAIEMVSGLPFGGTDCALPCLYALQHKLDVDTFVIYTDSQTWCGKEHTYQALNRYRKARNPNAKMAVVAMLANSHTLADPNDPGMMDLIGFDTILPRVLSDFVSDGVSSTASEDVDGASE